MTSTVYVLCPDLKSPFGGVMKLYELADTLNANGIKSFIVHEDKNLEIDWFNHTTPVTDFKSIKVKADDLLIIPEVFGSQIPNFYPGVRKIIFNQNSFYTLLPFNWDIELARKVYFHQDIVQVIVVSEYDFDFFSWLFPGLKISRIILGITDKLFYDQPHKQKIIAVMPRKVIDDYNQLIQLLLLKNDLDGYTIKIIDNLTLKECAAILREAAIFLSFSHKESFSLPPAEAMACGCIVIGYHGQGGKEFFRNDLTFVIEQSDMISYAKCVMDVIDKFKTNPLETQKIGKRASQFILERYSLANQERSILEVIRKFI
ncbi:glycosyltransferase family 4 protein [Pedobacter sp. L105]|uniref:glycosyltransferase family 4 protein n=1 Tax=Pedobacter sp. L105 TaxID=1641871 RepID=UPI00131B5247|nr:glycosyltransferase family 4 protein [Pedobacter sp. L105]